MSWAANSAGSMGTISLGGRRVRCGGGQGGDTLAVVVPLRPPGLGRRRTVGWWEEGGGGGSVEGLQGARRTVTLGRARPASLCHHQQASLKSAHFKGFLVKYQTLSGGRMEMAEGGMEG